MTTHNEQATPRTDAVRNSVRKAQDSEDQLRYRVELSQAYFELARQLERENADLQAKLEQERKSAEQALAKCKAEQQWNWDQINRLAKAINMLGEKTDDIISAAIRAITQEGDRTASDAAALLPGLEAAAKICDENAKLNRQSKDYGKGNDKSAMAWAFVDRAEFLAAAIRAEAARISAQTQPKEET